MHNLIARTSLDNRMLLIFKPIIEDMGFELVRIRLMDGKSKLIQVMIDKPDGNIMSMIVLKFLMSCPLL